MSRRMEPKNAEDVALDKKLAIGRTLLGLQHRLEIIDEKNELESAIKRSHAEEVNSGTVTVPELPSAPALIEWLSGTHALPAGDESAA